ncbi:unnamed protein product [Ceratitis capitata]|uniref:(Mediterranean fruit fly) hypothetical protein n=1 Tax=Ceratitis capitata TaxID=7213 RepID=A0A811VEC9_CERCA|nr:unnamed protein product [Ceratitis capitata]
MIDFSDKGKAEENIYYLKEQREKLRALRKKMKEMEGSLDASIEALEKVAKISTKLKENVIKKKEPKK